jgi:hypothetical protein
MASVFTPVFNADTGRHDPGPADIVYVDIDAAGAADGTSWTDAFTTMQAAVNAAGDGERIAVAAGTYDDVDILNFDFFGGADDGSFEIVAHEPGVIFRTGSNRIIYAGKENRVGIHGVTFDCESQALTYAVEFKGGSLTLAGCKFKDAATTAPCLYMREADGNSAYDFRAYGCDFAGASVRVKDADEVKIDGCTFTDPCKLNVVDCTTVSLTGSSWGDSETPFDVGTSGAAGASDLCWVSDCVNVTIDNCHAVAEDADTVFWIDPATVNLVSPTIKNCSVLWVGEIADALSIGITNGAEDASTLSTDALIENCRVDVPNESGDSSHHGVFICGAIGATIRNNVSTGGGYNGSVKLTSDPLVYGNTFSEPARQCFVDKACTRARVYNNTMFATGTGNAAMRVVEGDADEDVVDSYWYNNTVYVEDSAVAVQVDAGDLIDQDYIITNPAPMTPLFDTYKSGHYKDKTVLNIWFYNNTYYVAGAASNLAFTVEGVSCSLAEVQAHPDTAKGYFWEADGDTSVTVVT